MASKPKKAADLAREIWRLRGACENCPNTKERGYQLHGAHIFGVGPHIRICADLRNGFCLCFKCHQKFDNDHYFATQFIDNSWAKKYVPILQELARPSSGPKIDWDEEIAFLKEAKKNIQEGKITIEKVRELYPTSSP